MSKIGSVRNVGIDVLSRQKYSWMGSTAQNDPYTYPKLTAVVTWVST